MALVWADRVLETSVSTGTGALTLAAAITGHQRFSAVCSTNDTVYYAIYAVDSNGNPSGDWETGLGTYSSANTLTRTTPSASTNGGAAVNFAAGTKYVMLTPTAGFVGGLGGAYSPGGTDVALADGGTGASLADPNADRIMFWDDSAGQVTWLTAGTGLAISGTSIATSGLASTTQTAEQISGFIASPADKSYKVVVKMAHAGTITETTTISVSGTCTATFKVNTTALGGTANSVSSSEQSQSHSGTNTFVAGDDIVLTVSSNSSCVDMSFTIKYTRTLA